MHWFAVQLGVKKIFFSFLHSQDLELFVGVVIEALETLFVWEASSETSWLVLGAIRNTLRIVLFGWVKDYLNFTTFRVGRSEGKIYCRYFDAFYGLFLHICHILFIFCDLILFIERFLICHTFLYTLCNLFKMVMHR